MTSISFVVAFEVWTKKKSLIDLRNVLDLFDSFYGFFQAKQNFVNKAPVFVMVKKNLTEVLLINHKWLDDS